MLEKEIFDIAPIPLIVPFKLIFGSKEGLPKMEQSVVTVNVKLISANTVFGSLGSGSVPKSHTMAPFDPMLGL